MRRKITDNDHFNYRELVNQGCQNKSCYMMGKSNCGGDKGTCKMFEEPNVLLENTKLKKGDSGFNFKSNSAKEEELTIGTILTFIALFTLCTFSKWNGWFNTFMDYII
jgi:hypothetical protein